MRGFSNWEFRAKRAEQLPPSFEHPPPSQPSLQALLPAALYCCSDTQQIIKENPRHESQKPLEKRRCNGKLITSCGEGWNLLSHLALTTPSREGGRERYPISVAWGKRLYCLWDKHPPICFHPAAEVHACSHTGRGLACLLHAQNPCPSLSPAAGLVPEPPGQMAEEGEVLGQEQCDG